MRSKKRPPSGGPEREASRWGPRPFGVNIPTIAQSAQRNRPLRCSTPGAPRYAKSFGKRTPGSSRPSGRRRRSSERETATRRFRPVASHRPCPSWVGSLSPGLADHRLWSELLEEAGARCVPRAVSVAEKLPKSTTRRVLGLCCEADCLFESLQGDFQRRGDGAKRFSSAIPCSLFAESAGTYLCATSTTRICRLKPIQFIEQTRRDWPPLRYI